MIAERSKSDLLDLDASSIAQHIRAGRISSYEATKTYIQHIKHMNERINCLVEERFDEALREAKKCDNGLKEGAVKGQLFGVPIAVKDMFNVAGMRTTSGLVHRANTLESEDSEVVRRLKREGAIIIGKTNTGVLGLHFESSNKIHGTTNNPWDQSRTAGGSSGGCAALVASGGAAVSVGSDIFGSLRNPAHFNGVITFKCGAYQVSNEGHIPSPAAYPLQEAMLGIGALSKSVADAELINSIIANNVPPEVNVDEFRIVIPEPKYKVSKETRVALDIVRTYLKESFSVETNIDVPHLNPMLTIDHLQILSIDGGKDVWPIAFDNDERFPIFRTLVQELVKKNTDYDYFFLKTMALGKVGTVLFGTNSKKIGGLERKIAEKIADANRFLDKTILLLPSYPTPAKKHRKLDGEVFSNRLQVLTKMPYTSYANVLGLPALSVPITENKDGLPISLQLISRIGNEKALFHFGTLLEKEFRGYKRAKHI